ncbi:MAG TPA: hypothetical protein GXX36_16430 [Clostridiaceae bacterium]|nr:hypothetical protein [Clostridiaceae bacterium]
MKVYLEVGSFLKRFTSEQTNLEINISGDKTAAEVVLSAGVPEEEIGFITVNGQKVDSDYVLKENDIIRVYPIIVGG